MNKTGGVHYNIEYYRDGHWHCYRQTNRPTLDDCRADANDLLGQGFKVRIIKTTWLYKFEVVSFQPLLAVPPAEPPPNALC